MNIILPKARHTVIMSGRSSMNALHEAIPMLVLKHLHFDNGAARPEDRAAFWTLLGIPASHVEWVMRIDPRWNSETEQLLVRKDV